MRRLTGVPCTLGVALGLLAAAAPGPARAADPAAARTFVGRVLAAYGGWERLGRIKAYRVEGTLFSIRKHVEAPTIRVSAGPARLKVLIDYPDGHEARLLDGSRGWRAIEGGAFEPSTGPMRDAVVLQAARAAVPWILHDHLDDARLVEPIENAGVSCPGLEVALAGGLLLRVYVDPRTWRVAMSQGLLTHGGMQTHFETFYEDYRRVDGVWFAHREQNWASGTHTGTTTILKVQLDPPLGPDEFSPPEAAKGGVPPGRTD